MAGDPVQLGNQHPEVTGLLPDLMPHQFLDRQGPAEIHVHRRQVVEPVGVGNPLAGGEILADLLGTAVEIPDVGLGLRYDFTVGPQHQPQHAMRARVLRPHVDEHLVGTDVELDDPRIVFDEVWHGGSLRKGDESGWLGRNEGSIVARL